jgi:hypothetical protein
MAAQLRAAHHERRAAPTARLRPRRCHASRCRRAGRMRVRRLARLRNKGEPGSPPKWVFSVRESERSE